MNDLYQSQIQTVPKVTKGQVVELSKALSVGESRARNVGMNNTSTAPVKRVEQQAEYRMVNDAYLYAKEQYDRAFDAWAKGGYQE